MKMEGNGCNVNHENSLNMKKTSRFHNNNNDDDNNTSDFQLV